MEFPPVVHIGVVERAFESTRCAGRYGHRESHKAAVVGRTGYAHRAAAAAADMAAAVGIAVDVGLADRRVVDTFESAGGVGRVAVGDLAVGVEGAYYNRTAAEDMVNAKRKEVGLLQESRAGRMVAERKREGRKGGWGDSLAVQATGIDC